MFDQLPHKPCDKIVLASNVQTDSKSIGSIRA